MYRHNSELAKDVCKKTGFRFESGVLETMQRAGKIYVRGTAIKPDEARKLNSACRANNFVYRGPFAK